MTDKLITEKQTTGLIGKSLKNLRVSMEKIPSHTIGEMIPDFPFGVYGGILSQLKEIATGSVIISTCDGYELDNSNLDNAWISFEYPSSGINSGSSSFLMGYIQISSNNTLSGTYPAIFKIAFDDASVSYVSIYIPALSADEIDLSDYVTKAELEIATPEETLEYLQS